MHNSWHMPQSPSTPLVLLVKNKYHYYNMREEKPLFSVVTVVKDDVEGLQTTLLSVCAQSIPKAALDVLVIDGGFLPQVRMCVQACAGEKDAHAVRHVCGEDTGIYDAMNKGIGDAHGDWILFLNTGDVFCDATALMRVRSAMERYGDFADERKDYAYVAAAFYENLRNGLVPKNVVSQNALPCAMPTSHQALFIRKHVAMQHLFDLRYKVCADAHQMARVLKTGKKIFFSDERIVTVQAQGYSTNNFASMMRERIRIQRELYPSMRDFLRVGLFVAKEYSKRYVRMLLPLKIQDALRALKYANKKTTREAAQPAADEMKAKAPKSAKKKLLWITTALDESAVSKIFFLLAPYMQKKYDIRFLCIEPIKSSNAAQKLSEMGIALVSLECKKLAVLKAAKKLRDFIEKTSPDIMHAHLGRAYIIACAAYKRAKSLHKNTALLATLHNKFSYFSALTRLALTSMLPHFHGVSAVSQDCLNSYSQLFSKKNYRRLKSTVLHNPVEYAQTSHNPYGHKTDEAPLLFCASRLHKGKGHEHMLHMMAKFCTAYPHARLYLAGAGPLRKQLEALVQRLGLAQQVHFLGHIMDVYAYMKYADIVLFPSQDEGFGLVPCEAFLQETPVIMQDTPIARELFVSDLWYASCKDKDAFCTHVQNFWKNKERYHADLVREKRAIMQKFHPRTIAEQYLRWFENTHAEV